MWWAGDVARHRCWTELRGPVDCEHARGTQPVRGVTPQRVDAPRRLRGRPSGIKGRCATACGRPSPRSHGRGRPGDCSGRAVLARIGSAPRHPAATSRLFLTVARTDRHQRAGILAAYTWVGIDNAPTPRPQPARPDHRQWISSLSAGHEPGGGAVINWRWPAGVRAGLWRLRPSTCGGPSRSASASGGPAVRSSLAGSSAGLWRGR